MMLNLISASAFFCIILCFPSNTTFTQYLRNIIFSLQWSPAAVPTTANTSATTPTPTAIFSDSVPRLALRALCPSHVAMPLPCDQAAHQIRLWPRQAFLHGESLQLRVPRTAGLGSRKLCTLTLHETCLLNSLALLPQCRSPANTMSFVSSV